MAFIKCIECGKIISDKAERCINCGCPVSKMINDQLDVNSKIETEGRPDKVNKIKGDYGLIECPACHKKQMPNRAECYSCGTKFDFNNIEYCEIEEEKIDFTPPKAAEMNNNSEWLLVVIILALIIKTILTLTDFIFIILLFPILGMVTIGISIKQIAKSGYKMDETEWDIIVVAMVCLAVWTIILLIACLKH